jgi:hypothetical protein
MFHNQSKPEKSEAQQRRPGRSTGVKHQQPPKGSGVGGPSTHSSSPSSIIRSSKRSNGPGGQSRGKANAGFFEPNSTTLFKMNMHKGNNKGQHYLGHM